MAQIPTLPIDEPVAAPKAKPAEFGSVGETIAGLGEQTEQMALGNLAFEGHLIYANRQLKAKQAEVSIDQYMAQVYADLNKAVTVDDAQSVLDNAQNPSNIGPILQPYDKDPRLHQMVNLAWQQAQVHLQSVTNERKAHLIVQGTHAADAVNEEKTSQQAIGVGSTGEDYSAFRDRYEMGLRSGESAGVYPPQVVDELMKKWDRNVQKGIILSKINSPVQSVRSEVIKQLSEGGGSLKHDSLNSEEMGQLYTHAVDTDHNLTQKEEAGHLNSALNIKADWFSSQEFKNPDGTPNFEAREKALNDGPQLVAHGIVTPDGKPNRVMADKLLEDDARQWNMHQKVQRDKDEAVLEKYSPRIYDPKQPMSIAEIEALPQTEGASSRAVNQLKTALFQEQRQARAMRNEERSLSLQERQQKRRELEDKSIATSLSLADRMANGDVIDYNKDILEPISKGQMTEADGAKVWRMYKDSDQYPEIGEGVGVISAAFKALPQTPENNRKAMDARDAFLKTVKEKNLHGSAIGEEAQRIAEQNGKKATGSLLDSLFKVLHIDMGASVTSSAPTEAPKVQAAPRKAQGCAR